MTFEFRIRAPFMIQIFRPHNLREPPNMPPMVRWVSCLIQPLSLLNFVFEYFTRAERDMQAEYIVGLDYRLADARYKMVARANPHSSQCAADPFGGVDHLHKRTSPIFDKVFSLRRVANSYYRSILSAKDRFRFA
jgi:hypothetical protein